MLGLGGLAASPFKFSLCAGLTSNSAGRSLFLKLRLTGLAGLFFRRLGRSRDNRLRRTTHHRLGGLLRRALFRRKGVKHLDGFGISNFRHS